MEKHLATILKGILITGLSFFFISPIWAQKENEQSLITQDQIRQINEIVKPLKEKLDKQFNKDATYAAYLEDVRKITVAKSMEEKRSLSAKLDGMYLDYFKKVWAAANIDEISYQRKIRGCFPKSLAGLIRFDFFLNFSLAVSSNNTVPPVPELPPDKCLDICPIAEGEISGHGYFIGNGSGSYGNCFLKANSWAAVYGINGTDCYLRNSITIPGSFPDDARKLRIKKKYEFKQEATCFAVIGSWALIILKTHRSDEKLLVVAPVIWSTHVERNKTITEEYTLQKNEIAKAIFHIKSFIGASGISGSWCFTECNSIKWSICEER